MKNQHLCTGYDSPIGIDRRNFLQKFGGGLGGLALADMLHAESGTSCTIQQKQNGSFIFFSLAVPLKLIFLITNQD